MPRVNWDDTPDATDFNPLPDGWYECQVNNCIEKQSRNGIFFSIELVVTAGVHAGRKMFDTVHFSSKGAMKRTKLVCSRLGIDTHGVRDIEPADLIGKTALVQCAGTEKYVDKNGNSREKNIVPFAGYRAVDDKPDDDDTPF